MNRKQVSRTHTARGFKKGFFMSTKHGVMRVLTAFALLFSLAQLSSALPMDVLNDPNFVLPIDREPADYSGLQKSTAESSEAQLLYKSGDTVSFVCTERTFLSPTNAGGDCWGWVDGNGTEYGIYASWNYIEFYNIETGQLVDAIESPPSSWHDIKTYQNYCYAVSEGTGTNQGLMVMDMSYLPDSVHFVQSVSTSGSGHVTSHNLCVDTVAGYAYVEGTSTGGQSVRIFNLANPASPSYVSSFGPAGGLHDIYCMNDTLYLAEGWNPSFSIWNMANKFSPALLTRVTVPNSGYVHNIWPTDDRKYAVTTEETVGKTVKVWDIQNLGNVQLLGEYLAPSNLAHNAHIEGDTLFLSHYESGVAVIDLADPNNPNELSLYDTYPAGESSNFAGCWGVYPHTPSSRYYASNMDGYFFILNQFNTILADTVVALDAQAIAGADVKIDIWAKWSLDINQFEVPFQWSGPYNMTIDSVSTVGLATEYFEIQQFTAYDAFNRRAAYSLVASNGISSPDLPAGEGVIMSLYFSVPGGATGDSNLVTFTPFNGKEAKFAHQCIEYSPDTLSATITIGCCNGIRGNVDGDVGEQIDIADLVAFVDFSFGGGPAPACIEEADVDASSGTDIGDIVYLVTYMFDSGPAPLACP